MLKLKKMYLKKQIKKMLIPSSGCVIWQILNLGGLNWVQIHLLFSQALKIKNLNMCLKEQIYESQYCVILL